MSQAGREGGSDAKKGAGKKIRAVGVCKRSVGVYAAAAEPSHLPLVPGGAPPRREGVQGAALPPRSPGRGGVDTRVVYSNTNTLN